MRTQRLDTSAAGPARVARWARAAFALAALLAVGPARADRLRMLVLVGGEPQREIAARIKGQTADLDAVVATAEGAMPADLDGQLAVARAAAARADVVVWFATGSDGEWIAYIARRELVLSRRIAVEPGALSRSASHEAVALAVRTALTGFVASARAEAEDGAELARRRPAFRAWAALGGTGALDGARAAGHYGAALRGGVARGRWHLGALLAYHPPAAVDATSASIRVERDVAGVVLGAELLPGPTASGARWTLALELGVGAARFSRTTTATGSGLVATPGAATWTPLVSPGLRVARRVISGTWLALDVGADALVRAPQFGVQRAGTFERLASVWPVQPRVALSLLLDWR